MLAEASPRAKLQCIEEGEQPIPRLIASSLLPFERLDLGQRRLLQCEVCVQVDLVGLDGLVPKPERDNGDVHASLEQFHRRAMSEDMRGDPLAAERGASQLRGLSVACQQTLHSVRA